MNRSELVDKVSETSGLDKHQAESAVKAVLDTVMAETRSGEKVSVFGFGTFTPTSRAARTGRNPRTGEPVKIKASKSVRFAPAAAYKTSLNAKGSAKKAAAKKSAPAASKSAAPAPAKKAAPAPAAKKTAAAPAAKKATAAKKTTAAQKSAPATTAATGKQASAAKKTAPAAAKKATTAAKTTKKSAKK